MVQDLISQIAVSVFSLVFVVVGLYQMNAGRNERAQSKRIADTETTRIRDLQAGPVEVKGTAHPAAESSRIESPITKVDALATRVQIEEWESSGQGGGNWQTKHETVDAVAMTVDDGTGEVQVDLPPDGELNVEQTQTTVGSGDEPPESIRRYVENEADVDVPTRRDFGPLSVGERRRYSEGVIEPGEGVYVLGTASEMEAGWGERAFVIDEPTDDGDFVLSDKSEADLISEGKRGGLVSLAFGGLLTLVGTSVTIIAWL